MKRLILFLSVLLLFTCSYGQGIIRANGNARAVDEETKSVYTDDFEAHTAGALAGKGNWIVAFNGAITVVDVAGDNQVYANEEYALSGVKYNDTFNDNQYSQIKIDNNGAGYISVGVRLTGANATLDGYWSSIYNTAPNTFTVQLWRFDDGAPTTLDSQAGVTINNGDVIRIEATGTTITLKINGTGIAGIGTDGSLTDATYSSGVAGFGGYHNYGTIKYDDWEGGDL
jgi:hypothetical protein